MRPIQTAHLFAPLARRLGVLLASLTETQWRAPTCYPQWKVKDIAAHLLQTSLSRLARQRDGLGAGPPRENGPAPAGGPPVGESAAPPFTKIARIVARINREWERTAAGLSPRLIVSLLAVAEKELASFFRTLDPHGRAFYAVSWAGESASEHWFDVAREYTERWHHQAQIREAVGAPPLDGRRFFTPVLETLMRALPFWYDELETADGVRTPGAIVRIRVTGGTDMRWNLRRGETGWQVAREAADGPVAAEAAMTADTAWKHLTRTISPAQARPLIRFSGDQVLAERFLGVKAIMMEE